MSIITEGFTSKFIRKERLRFYIPVNLDDFFFMALRRFYYIHNTDRNKGNILYRV